MTRSKDTPSDGPIDLTSDDIRDDLRPEELRALAGEEAAAVIEEWPSQPREAAVKTVQRYGAPDAVMPSRLIWTAKGHWRRVIVNRAVVPHHFPKPHNDLLEEWIAYSIPPERLDDVAAFDSRYQRRPATATSRRSTRRRHDDDLAHDHPKHRRAAHSRVAHDVTRSGPDRHGQLRAS